MVSPSSVELLYWAGFLKTKQNKQIKQNKHQIRRGLKAASNNYTHRTLTIMSQFLLRNRIPGVSVAIYVITVPLIILSASHRGKFIFMSLFEPYEFAVYISFSGLTLAIIYLLEMPSLAFLLFGCMIPRAAAVIPLYVLGLYPMSGSWPGGQGQLPATQMGFEHINSNGNILANYTLNLISKDTEVRKCFLLVYLIWEMIAWFRYFSSGITFNIKDMMSTKL